MRGIPTKRLLRASRKAGVKSIPCYWASVLKCWLTKMKQDMDLVTITESFDPSLLFKLIEKFVLKQSDNQYKTAVLRAEQMSNLLFCQDNQIGNAVYYDRFTTRVEVACWAGVC
jgi:hypothetical protein